MFKEIWLCLISIVISGLQYLKNGGHIMSKLIKRISSIAAAALMATTMAVSASADSKTIGPEDFGNGKVRGILSANASSNYCYAATSYTKSSSSVRNPQKLSVAVDIDDTFTGECYKSLGPTTNYDTTYVSAGAYMWDNVTVTLFGAFSLTYDGVTWGDYGELYSVRL